MEKTIRLGIADKHTLFRSGLQKLLQDERDIEIVWSVESISEAADQADATPADVIMIDFTDPSSQLIQEVSEFRNVHPSTHLIAVTDHGSDRCVLFNNNQAAVSPPAPCCLQQAFMLGARGAIRKTSNTQELVRVIRSVHAGQITVEEPSLSLLLSRLFGRSPADAAQPGLTGRQKEVIQALALGKSNKEIAVSLGIAEQTVKNHVSQILEKLGLEDRVQIVVFAARHRLVSLDNL